MMTQDIFPPHEGPVSGPPAVLALRDYALRHDFPAFIRQAFYSVNPGAEFLPNWHIDLIGEYLDACRRGELTRLIINMPPRALKSLCVSVAWPAFLLGHNPAGRILAASYSAQLAFKHSQDCRLVMNAPWYRRLFPGTALVAGENEKHKFVTTRRGFRFATSVGGTATGEGGDVLIVDDPLSPMQAASPVLRAVAARWFDHTFASRLDDKRRGAIVLVMQRLHEDDLTGHLLAKHSGWEQLCLPAIADAPVFYARGKTRHLRMAGEALHEAREGIRVLERVREDLGSYAFAAQYQQQPVAVEGAMIHANWLRRYDATPIAPDRVVQSWDTAIKAGDEHDASVCLTFALADAGYYLIESLVLRAEYPQLRRAVLRQAERFEPAVILMEDKASGQSLLQDLRRDTSLPLVAVMPRGDKITRLAAASGAIESGRLLLPRSAPWLAAFETELLRFPLGAHDDQVDALSQFLHWAKTCDLVTMQVRTV